MDLGELLKGESKNIEYKSELPKKSEKYMKSVIAFANFKRAKEYGLREPEFLEIGDTFRVNLYRYENKKADKKPINIDRQKRICKYLEECGKITNKEARELLGLADSTTKRILKQMVQEEILCVEGERKARIYKLK